MSNNDITVEELLRACLEPEENEAPELPALTSDCPSLRQFEAHAKGTRFLGAEAMRHVNRCTDYCQGILERFRRECRNNKVRFADSSTQRLVADAETGNAQVYDAVVESGNGDVLGTGRIMVTDGPFLTPEGHLLFRLAITDPRFQPEMFPLEVSMTDLSAVDGCVFRFDLPTQGSEIVKMKLPSSLLKETKWRTVQVTGKLPLSFVLCPLGPRELLSLG